MLLNEFNSLNKGNHKLKEHFKSEVFVLKCALSHKLLDLCQGVLLAALDHIVLDVLSAYHFLALVVSSNVFC